MLMMKRWYPHFPTLEEKTDFSTNCFFIKIEKHKLKVIIFAVVL